jgi:hypothetical protein
MLENGEFKLLASAEAIILCLAIDFDTTSLVGRRRLLERRKHTPANACTL